MLPHARLRITHSCRSNTEEHALDHNNCTANLTGGNKLRAMAAAEWCRLASRRCFYQERDSRAFAFLPKGSDLLRQPG